MHARLGKGGRRLASRGPEVNGSEGMVRAAKLDRIRVEGSRVWADLAAAACALRVARTPAIGVAKKGASSSRGEA